MPERLTYTEVDPAERGLVASPDQGRGQASGSTISKTLRCSLWIALIAHIANRAMDLSRRAWMRQPRRCRSPNRGSGRRWPTGLRRQRPGCDLHAVRQMEQYSGNRIVIYRFTFKFVYIRNGMLQWDLF